MARSLAFSYGEPGDPEDATTPTRPEVVEVAAIMKYGSLFLSSEQPRRSLSEPVVLQKALMSSETAEAIHPSDLISQHTAEVEGVVSLPEDKTVAGVEVEVKHQPEEILPHLTQGVEVEVSSRADQFHSPTGDEPAQDRSLPVIIIGVAEVEEDHQITASEDPLILVEVVEGAEAQPAAEDLLYGVVAVVRIGPSGPALRGLRSMAEAPQPATAILREGEVLLQPAHLEPEVMVKLS